MRKLYKEELEGLHQEFIAYLIMQGVDADHWQKLKQEDKERAESLIEEFSMHYFNTMISGISFITHSTPNAIHTIHFRTTDASEFIFVREKSSIAHKTTTVSNRTSEIFNYLEQGYKPDNGEVYKNLALLHADHASDLST